MNVLKHYGVIGGSIAARLQESGAFIGNALFPVVATEGGFIEHLVKPNDKVSAGQKLVVQRNAFGEVVAEYESFVDGEVGAIRSDSSSEPGNVLVFILYQQQAEASDGDYPE